MIAGLAQSNVAATPLGENGRSLAGLPAFAGYFAAAAVLSVLFVVIYTAITPFREIDLIRKGNSAAAIEIGMALIGFSIPLASAIYHSANLIDCVIWGVVTLIVQLAAYGVARLTIPNPASDIAEAHVPQRSGSAPSRSPQAC